MNSEETFRRVVNDDPFACEPEAEPELELEPAAGTVFSGLVTRKLPFLIFVLALPPYSCLPPPQTLSLVIKLLLLVLLEANGK